MSAEFVLRLAAPVMAGGDRPLLEIGLSASATDLRWTWDQTGPAGASVGVGYEGRAPSVGPLPEPIDAPLRAHAEIWSGSAIVWEGFVRTRERGQGGLVTGLGLVGYAQSMNDGWWSRSDLSSAMTSGEVLATALVELAPWLRPGVTGEQWVDPQVSYSAGMNAVARMTPGQIADQIRQQGDTRGREVWVMCQPGRRVWIVPRVAPSEPEYRIPFDERVTRWTDSDEGMAAAVTIERGTSSSGTLGNTGTNPNFASDRGFAPSLLITAGNVELDSADAMRNAELSRRAVPRVAATLAAGRDPATWLANRYGVPVPYWQPRPGEWVGVAGEALLPIVGVSVDANGATATYDLGTPARHRLVSVLARDTIARYRAMLASNGGRLRT